MRILVDMNLSPRWIVFLKDAGIEATHWSSVGAMSASDSEIMAFAKAHDYVVMTHDLDFSGILASTHGEKPSVIQIRSDDVSPTKIGMQILLALSQMQIELDNGALVTIDPVRLRVRLLPLMDKKSSDT